jgi:hypothetical protein
MKIILFSWTITDAWAFDDGLAFTTSLYDDGNLRKEVEVGSTAELKAEMEKFAEELRATGKPFRIGQRQVRGSRAFSGYKSFRNVIHVNVEKLEEEAKAKKAASAS